MNSFQDFNHNEGSRDDEFKGFKIIIDRNFIRSTAFNGTNGSGIQLYCRNGNYTAEKVTVRETSINNKVIRVPLPRGDLKILQEKAKIITVNRKKRRVNERRLTKVIRKSLQHNIKTESKKISKKKTINQIKNIEVFPPKSLEKNNKQMDSLLESSPCLHREILFVKQYKTNQKQLSSQNIYYLKFPDTLMPEDGKLNYQFQTLVTDVKTMKLPSPTWKIKVIIRRNKISAIIFTNKLELERSVSFKVDSDHYDVMIDNKPAFLLGSPGILNDAKDVEILLDIVQNIDSNSPMILYK